MLLMLISRATFFARPEKAFPQISPCGNYIAYLAYQGNHVKICLLEIAADDFDNATIVYQSENPGISFFWTYNRHHLLVMEQSISERRTLLHVVDFVNKTQKQICADLGGAFHILDQSAKQPGQVLVGNNGRTPAWFDIYRIDFLTGDVDLVYKNDRFSGFLASDLELKLAVADLPNGDNEYYLAVDQLDWQALFVVSAEDAQTTTPLCVDARNNTIYLKDTRNHDTRALTRLDIETGDLRTLAQDDKADIDDVLLNPETYQVDAVSFNYVRKRWQAISKGYENDLAFLHQENEGDLAITSRDHSECSWVVGYANDDQPNSYYLYRRGDKQLVDLFSNITEFESLPLRKMHHFVSRTGDDKFSLLSYYTLPEKGKTDEERFPLIVLVHGGPWTRDKWGYNPWHQWLANRGYAVLSVNFRGSDGFGKAFMNAGNREWGGRMIDDVHDATMAFINRESIDSNRVGIMGTSYGGYAALMLASRYPSRYRCAVDLFGPTDLVYMIESIPNQWQSQKEMLVYRVGNPDTKEGRELLAQQSPINWADSIQCSLLLVEGVQDPRVNRYAIHTFADTITDKNQVPLIHLSFPDEGHNLANDKNRITFCAIAERFLQKYLQGQCEAWDEKWLQDVDILHGEDLINQG